MAFTIRGAGDGREVKVSDDNKLETKSVATSLQHYVSHHKGLAYQVWGEIDVSTTNDPVLYLENISNDNTMIVSYIRVNTVGVAAASTASYATVNLGCSYTSGGAAKTPTNMNQSSPNAAAVTAYDGTSSLTLVAGTEIDRNYQVNEMQRYNKEGTIVIPKGGSICISFKGSTVAGKAYARISFFMDHL